jgi:hypothetical protein
MSDFFSNYAEKIVLAKSDEPWSREYYLPRLIARLADPAKLAKHEREWITLAFENMEFRDNEYRTLHREFITHR